VLRLEAPPRADPLPRLADREATKPEQAQRQADGRRRVLAASAEPPRKHRRDPPASPAAIAPDTDDPDDRLSRDRGGATDLAFPKPVPNHHEPLPGRPARGPALTAATRPGLLGRRNFLCPFLDVDRRIDDPFTARSLHETREHNERREWNQGLSLPILWPTLRRCALLSGRRLYIIDRETAQSPSLLGTRFAPGPVPQTACANVPPITSSGMRRNN